MTGLFRQQYRLKSGGVDFGPKVWINVMLEKKEKKYPEGDKKKGNNSSDNKKNNNSKLHQNNVEPDLFKDQVKAIQKSLTELGLSLDQEETSVDRILAMIFRAKQKNVTDNDLVLAVINSFVEMDSKK